MTVQVVNKGIVGPVILQGLDGVARRHQLASPFETSKLLLLPRLSSHNVSDRALIVVVVGVSSTVLFALDRALSHQILSHAHLVTLRRESLGDSLSGIHKFGSHLLIQLITRATARSSLTSCHASICVQVVINFSYSCQEQVVTTPIVSRCNTGGCPLEGRMARVGVGILLIELLRAHHQMVWYSITARGVERASFRLEVLI